MKPTLNQQIESSQKGIDYVNSLVPTDQDCINASKWQIEDVFMKGIKNNLPEMMKKHKKKQNHLAMFVFVCVTLGIVLYVALIINLILEKL